MNYSPSVFDLESTVNRINTICSTMFDAYLYKYPNVVGIALGIKTVNNTPLDLPSLTFLVEKKIPDAQLPPEGRIPETVDGLITDVIQVGTLKPFSYSYYNRENTFNFSNSYQKVYPQSVDNNDDRKAAVQGGASIGYFQDNTPATIGCAVHDDNNIYILSCGHAIASDGAEYYKVGCPLIEPAKAFGGQENNFLASLYSYTPINFPTDGALGPASNTVDAGLARVGDMKYADNILANVLKKGIKGYDEITLSNVALGESVVKVGAASGETKGTVIAVNAALKIQVNDQQTVFIKQILTTAMAKPGDSGSIGLTQSSGAFGLLMGGSDKITIYNPLQDALNLLKVKIWNSTQ